MDDAFIKKLGLYIADPTVLQEMGRKPVKTMAIPYFDLDGKQIDFVRYRYLADTRTTWEKLTNAKVPRYFQPAGTGLHPYFPPILDWRKIAENPKIPLIITEGEKKAACACAHGFPAIGLGGVDCFATKFMGSKKDGAPLLPELEEFQWEGRDVIIMYDSDASTNVNVLAASVRLGRSLYVHKANPRVAYIPPTSEGAKQGVDDLIFNAKKNCVSVQTTMANLIQTANKDLFEREIALFDFNSQFVYVRDLDKIVCRDDGTLLEPTAFSKRAYASRKHREFTTKIVEKKRELVTKEVSTADAWNEWTHKLMVKTLDFSPTEGEFTKSGYNLWKGWPVTPKPGSATLWTELLDKLFQNVPTDERTWFEQWCAFPVQNPGAKLKTAVLIWSVMEGNGKSTILECLRAVYGSLYVPMNDSAVDLQYTDWMVNKLLVGVDDISAKNRDDHAAKWKNLVTAPRLSINKKYMSTFEISSHVNFIMTSNEPNALRLTPADRRYFIHEAAAWGTKEQCAEWCARVYLWLEKDGPGALLHHLSTLDLTGFDPDAPAPLTRSKLDMVEAGKGPLEKWLEDLRDAPDLILSVGQTVPKGDLWSADDLVGLYNNRPDGKTHVTRVTMGMALAIAGFKQAYRGQTVRLLNGKKARLVAVRNPNVWETASGPECAKHYEETRG